MTDQEEIFVPVPKPHHQQKLPLQILKYYELWSIWKSPILKNDCKFRVNFSQIYSTTYTLYRPIVHYWVYCDCGLSFRFYLPQSLAIYYLFATLRTTEVFSLDLAEDNKSDLRIIPIEGGWVMILITDVVRLVSLCVVWDWMHLSSVQSICSFPSVWLVSLWTFSISLLQMEWWTLDLYLLTCSLASSSTFINTSAAQTTRHSRQPRHEQYISKAF